MSHTVDHTACRRAFYPLLHDEPARANQHYEAAVAWLQQVVDDADADFDLLP